MISTVIVKVTPGAKKNYIGDRVQDSAGRPMLKVYVTAAPENGKANEAVIELLANHWKVGKKQLTIIRGATSRIKTIQIKSTTFSS